MAAPWNLDALILVSLRAGGVHVGQHMPGCTYQQSRSSVQPLVLGQAAEGIDLLIHYAITLACKPGMRIAP
jgi:hypothetical protein